MKEGERSRLTKALVDLLRSRKIQANPAQRPPNIPTIPSISRANILGGTRFPNAFERRKPGKASLSMA